MIMGGEINHLKIRMILSIIFLLGDGFGESEYH